MVIQKVGGKSRLVFKTLPADETKQCKNYLALAKAKLNWEPKIKLEAGWKKH
jgi:UDP-glucuronate decarboxylase